MRQGSEVGNDVGAEGVDGVVEVRALELGLDRTPDHIVDRLAAMWEEIGELDLRLPVPDERDARRPDSYGMVGAR